MYSVYIHCTCIYTRIHVHVHVCTHCTCTCTCMYMYLTHESLRPLVCLSYTVYMCTCTMYMYMYTCSTDQGQDTCTVHVHVHVYTGIKSLCFAGTKMHLANITFHMHFCILFVAPHVHLLGFTNGEMCRHFSTHDYMQTLYTL